MVGLSGVNGGGLSSTLSLNFDGATRPVGVNALDALSGDTAMRPGSGDGLSACGATGRVSGGGVAGVVSPGGVSVTGVIDAASAAVAVWAVSDTVSAV